MPNKRRPVQEAHERFVVGDFLEKFNHRHHSRFRVIEEPNPPEAIIESRRSKRWVEVTAAFWTEAHAQDLYSFATPEEDYKPEGDGPFMNMTDQFASRFAAVVKQKLEKTSYVPFRDLYGPGYLVVSVQFPFFSRNSIPVMQRAFKGLTVNDLGCFRSIYLHYRLFKGYGLSRWRQ